MKSNTSHLNFNHLSERQVLVAFVVMAVITFMATNNVHAGTDVTFATVQTMLTNWITGSYGKIAALGVLGVGLAIAIVKQSLMFVAVGVGIAIVAVAGPGILNGLVTATL